MEGTFKYLNEQLAKNPPASAPNPLSGAPNPPSETATPNDPDPKPTCPTQQQLALPKPSLDSAPSCLAAVALSGLSSIPRGNKLRYIDFLPRKLKSHTFSPDEYETFSALVTRVNAWLDEHREAELIQCETVSWFGDKQSQIFSDSTIMHRKNRCSSTRIWIQGIRVWYRTDALTSSYVASRYSRGIDCKTVLATSKKETFSNLVDRINNELNSSKYSVQIICAETVRVFGEVGRADPELMYWKETSSERKVVWAIRVFALVRPIQGQDIIGYKDFVPEDRQRTRANKGYEIFSDVSERVASWMFLQQNVKFINLQTLTAKVKQNQQCTERCSFTEHCSGVTRYLKFVRVYYVITRHAERSEQVAPAPGLWLNCRTFHPFEVKLDTSKSSDEMIFEELRGLIDRISSWLQTTDAKLFSLETLKELKMQSKEAEESVPTSEITYIKDCGKTASFVFNIRVYIQGNCTEPPAASALAAPSSNSSEASKVPPKNIVLADPTMVISPAPAAVSYQPTILRAVHEFLPDKHSQAKSELRNSLDASQVIKNWRPNPKNKQ